MTFLGIHMGTNGSHLLIDMFLYSYEAGFCIKTNKTKTSPIL